MFLQTEQMLEVTEQEPPELAIAPPDAVAVDSKTMEALNTATEPVNTEPVAEAPTTSKKGKA
jgi:hypothetical protein